MKPPRTAYILLWFPKPSETFVFREVVNLRRFGLPLKVFTLYGLRSKGMSSEMRAAVHDVERLGIPYIGSAPQEVLYWMKRNRPAALELLRTVPFRRWRGLEKSGESLWAALCGFRLARRFEEEGIEHIHAPWASGPASAAWVASRLTGIPFSFTARAWDIYPPDSLLREKLRDATLVRSETKTNIPYLAQFLESGADKIHLTYNGLPLHPLGEAPVAMQSPYKLLAVGRFVGKKGYDYLLKACRMLQDSGIDFQLTMAGDGPRGPELKHLAKKLDLSDRVSFPGFVNYDQVSELFRSADLFLMPSIVHSSGDRDGIPTVIMEALMHRVPVIATDVSGIAEVIQDRVTGLLIPEKNAEAIYEAVKTMVGDRESAVRMAEKGRDTVRQLFDPETNHRGVFQLYSEYFPPQNGNRA